MIRHLLSLAVLAGCCFAQNNNEYFPISSSNAVAATDIAVTVNGKPQPVVDVVVSRPQGAAPLFIVVDALHTQLEEQPRLRGQALDFLREAVSARRPVGLFTTFRGGLRVIHHPDTDPQVTLAALNQIASETVNARSRKSQKADVDPAIWKSAPDNDVKSEAARLLAFANGIDLLPGFSGVQVLYVQQVLSAWDALAHSFATAPGRKKLVWITGSLPFELDGPKVGSMNRVTLTEGSADYGSGDRYSGDNARLTMNDSTPDMTGDESKAIDSMWQDSVRSLQRSGISVYPFDVPTHTALASSRIIASLQQLASMTAGHAFFGTNDLSPALKQVVAEPETLVYAHLQVPAGKSQWSKVAVTAKGTAVQAPSGFFTPRADEPPPAVASSAPKQATNGLLAALQSSTDLNDVPFAVSAQPGSPVKVQFQLPVSSVKLDQANGNHVSIDFAAMAFDDSHQERVHNSQRIDTKIPAEAMPQILQYGVSSELPIALPAGSYTLRVAVRDGSTGKIGTKTVKVSVP